MSPRPRSSRTRDLAARHRAGIRGRIARASGRSGDVRPVPHGRLVLPRHALAVNRPVHLVHRADAGELLSAVERWRASTLYAIPAVWERILADGAAYHASSLREVLTGTSRVDLDLVGALKARFPGTWTSVAYGSTEIGPGAVLTDADLYLKPLSVGLPPPTVEARIDADDELLQHGPTMFSGYVDRPDATADAIDADGWYHTGDLATGDADGYLTITGRRSEGIRSGGEWIAPVEVEAAVLTHPAVAEVGVVGLPDPRWGELVCAAIVAGPARRCRPSRNFRARRHTSRGGQASARRGRRRAASPHRRHRSDPPCGTPRRDPRRRRACVRLARRQRCRPACSPSGWPRKCRAVPRRARRTRSCSGCSRSRHRTRTARAWPCAAARSNCTPPTSTTR